jgi:hypothetical protein
MRNTLNMLVIVTVIFLSAGIGNSTPLLWTVNNHYYEAIPSTLTLPSIGFESWAEARDQAASMSYLGMQGHLATLTSQAEDEWVWNNLSILDSSGSIANLFRFLLGGYQDPNYAELGPSDNWKWVTGEPWVWTNWDGTEPNNGNGSYEEDALSFYKQYGQVERPALFKSIF